MERGPPFDLRRPGSMSAILRGRMSEENMEVAQRAIQAWSRAECDAWLALWDEDAGFYHCVPSWKVVLVSATTGCARFLAEVGRSGTSPAST
jgi:hypothetical protein